MTKEIPLTQGQVALVDDADFEWLCQWKWRATRKPGEYTYYALRTGPNRKALFLHHAIMKPPSGMQIDHINGNGLDCRRANMRLATNAENNRNRGAQANNALGIKGVSLHKARGKLRAQITVNGVNMHLGYFDSTEAAAQAYDEAARKYFGEFARTNEVAP